MYKDLYTVRKDPDSVNMDANSLATDPKNRCLDLFTR
jgi:hypothetical protein